MGATTAAEKPVARTWPQRRTESPLDRGPRPQKAEEDSNKQVSVHRGQGRDPAISASQKVKEAGRDFSYLLVVLIGIGIAVVESWNRSQFQRAYLCSSWDSEVWASYRACNGNTVLLLLLSNLQNWNLMSKIQTLPLIPRQANEEAGIHIWAFCLITCATVFIYMALLLIPVSC